MIQQKMRGDVGIASYNITAYLRAAERRPYKLKANG